MKAQSTAVDHWRQKKEQNQVMPSGLIISVNWSSKVEVAKHLLKEKPRTCIREERGFLYMLIRDLLERCRSWQQKHNEKHMCGLEN